MSRPALLALLAAIRSLLWSRAQLPAEVLALRHQLLVLKRQCAGRRVHFQTSDRVLWSWLSRLWPGWRQGLLLVRPETVVRWRQGFRVYRRWKSCSRCPDDRALSERFVISSLRCIARIPAGARPASTATSSSSVSQSPSRRSPSICLAIGSRPPRAGGRSSRIIFGKRSPSTAVVSTVTFGQLYVVLSLERRRLLHINVTAHPTPAWTAQQMVEALPEETSRRHLIRDRDAIYGTEFRRRVTGMGLVEVPIAPRSPWQNGYVERFVGSLRRECLDH